MQVTMVETWFTIVAVTFTLYVVMDGFDLGAGALHLFIARGDAQRRQVLGAIGPYWDGNEVWLIAAGGALFIGFPSVLASGLSGFYLAIFFLLWSLILRGISIELRSHVKEPLWRAFWDFMFAASSALLAVLFGAALGNLIRGVPLNDKGWFELPLFTDFSTQGAVGLLDWYTVCVGAFALLALSAHGATFLAWKTAGELTARVRAVSLALYAAVAVAWPLMTLATARINAGLLSSLRHRPVALVFAVLAIAGLTSVFIGHGRKHPLFAFLGSSLFLAGVLAATAACMFPTILRSTTSASVSAHDAAADASSLRIALYWGGLGLPLVAAYFVLVFKLHREKVTES
jgi:cytochrome bd ubiquinol oxidase subunit II